MSRSAKKVMLFIWTAVLTVVFLSSPALVSGKPRLQVSREEVYQQKEIPIYKYRLIRTYPHDTTSYTEGLVVQGNRIYEGTGRYGRSRLMLTDLDNGQILKEVKLDPRYFGEGITVLGDEIYQLTYISNTGFVYDRESLTLKKTFHYFTQGWGLTHNGNELIMSDGSAALHFFDPVSLFKRRSIIIRNQEGPVGFLNELEEMEGKLLANIWQTELVAIIDPQTAKVVGWVDLHGLNPDPEKLVYPYVLNGLAYDRQDRRLFVTGKCWPHIYEIELIPAAGK